MARIVQQSKGDAAVEACFFFGTLMHPRILQRVIGHGGAQLQAFDAVLHGYTRHHVRNEDYPAIVPADQGRNILRRELSKDEASVRGTLVTGLSYDDLLALDTFEGDEYARDVVEIERLVDGQNEPPMRAWAYIWDVSIKKLAPSLWSYDDFCKDKLSRWVQSDEEFAEVDRRRAMNGHITPTEGSLGHACRDFWRFEPGWRNLNHGSYGICPAPVIEAQRKVQNEIEAAPCRFMKRKLNDRLIEVRQKMADFVCCCLDELMVVPNTTTAIDSILRSLRWREGDAIIVCSTIYGSCGNIVQHLIDSRPEMQLTMLKVQLDYPLSDDDVLKAVDETIKSSNAKRIRLALFDAISSTPGVRVPWERLVERLRRDRILSLVDGAHALGNLQLDLNAVDPDFFVSNAHKHLYAPRPCAILYVPRRNQPLVHSMPIGHTYQISPTAEMPAPSSTLIAEWAWTSSSDWSAMLSLGAVLDFRKQLGGEQAIIEYTRELARSGGKAVAETLGTEVMENEQQTLTTSMVNVRLPIDVKSKNVGEQWTVARDSANRLMDEFDTHIQIFAYRNALWARFTAQVYLELEDFRWGGETLKRICDELNESRSTK